MTEVDYEAAVAIIGMAGRFPGAGSVDELWQNLLAGKLGLRQLADEELASAGVSPAQLADPGYVRTSGSISGYEMFDAAMFGLNRREAEGMDPQHRLFLETCFEALENAGYPPMDMPGKVGVFAGCGFPDYMNNLFLHTMAQPGGQLMMAIGCERDSLASYASYKLNLRGPSITVQAFCSTSLIAVHLAAQSLLSFECEVAIAGGAFIPLPQGTGYAYEEGGILAPDGVVRAFDAAARGSVMGSGVSVVTLKRLTDAMADGDSIAAVILGSATNNDGSACAGYTAPGVDGQSAVIADALTFAGVKPETIDYVECHGTGTVLGDSIELAAMARQFPDRPADPLILGSLKASIGHLDRAAGTSSLIRAALALRERVLPATPNYENPNPALAASRAKFAVLAENRPWPERPTPRRAGVSAFGLGGSNAHVILEEGPARPAAAERQGPHILVLSARDATAADKAVENLLRHLDRHREQVIADVAFTLQQSRAYFPIRRAVVCEDATDALVALGEPRRWLTGETRQRDPLVELVLPDLAAADAGWRAGVAEAASRILGGESEPSAAGLALAIARALTRLGVRIGRISGQEDAPELARQVARELGVAGDRSCPVQLVVGPAADGSPAGHWLAQAIARLWLAGTKVNWAVLHPGGPRRVALPSYPFQRRRYWVDGMAGFGGMPAESGGRKDDVGLWTYAPTWRGEPAPIRDLADEIQAAGPWLVLAAEERGEAIVSALRRAGTRVLAVRPGADYAGVTSDDFLVRPGEAADLHRVLATAGEPPARVIHGFGLGERAGRSVGYASALALVTAYAMAAPALDVDLTAVTESAVSIAGQPPGYPDQAALGGLLPVLAQETPGWTCRQVDIGAERPDSVAAGPAAGAALASAVIAEALGPYQGPVALRGTSRWVRSFAPLPLPAPAEPLAAGSVVLITGGLGHVGLILTRHLALGRGCRVVLTSRTALPPRQEWDEHAIGSSRTARHVAALLEIELQGGEVLVVTADASDPAQMRAAVSLADATFGGIDLVVHAAGISDGSGFGPAHLLSGSDADQHFTSKQGGFEALREVLAGRDIPGITLSSLSAVLGGLSLGPYAAANAALDAHVLAARGLDGLRWVTVDWDTWGGRDALPAGEFDMAPAEGVQVFERAVAAIGRADHIVISTGSLDARFRQWVIDRGLGGALADNADDDFERDPRPDLSTPYVMPEEGTEAGLAAIWARVLRLDRVGADDDFFGLGGNSVLAIEVVARIRKDLKVPVPTSAVLGFPTVRGLAAQIDDPARQDFEAGSGAADPAQRPGGSAVASAETAASTGHSPEPAEEPAGMAV